MGSSILHHDIFLAEMSEPLLSHVWSQAEVDAYDASVDVTILLKILLDFLQHRLVYDKGAFDASVKGQPILFRS